MNSSELESYLHQQIPASAALQVAVKQCSPEFVELAAPLSANLNHKNTAFGGSLSVIAILAGWSLVFMRLRGIKNEIVIQESSISYLKPVVANFTASCHYQASSQWSRFYRALEKVGKARIVITSEVHCDGAVVATHTGTYVAFKK